MPNLRSEFEDANMLVSRYADLDDALAFVMKDLGKIARQEVARPTEFAQESLRALSSFLEIK